MGCPFSISVWYSVKCRDARDVDRCKPDRLPCSWSLHSREMFEHDINPLIEYFCLTSLFSGTLSLDETQLPFLNFSIQKLKVWISRPPHLPACSLISYFTNILHLPKEWCFLSFVHAPPPFGMPSLSFDSLLSQRNSGHILLLTKFLWLLEAV